MPNAQQTQYDQDLLVLYIAGRQEKMLVTIVFFIFLFCFNQNIFSLQDWPYCYLLTTQNVLGRGVGEWGVGGWGQQDLEADGTEHQFSTWIFTI